MSHRNPFWPIRDVCSWLGASWLMDGRRAGLLSGSTFLSRRLRAGPAAIGSWAKTAWKTTGAGR